MANTQKEKLNSRQIKIKSDLDFGVINPLRYDINSKTLSLKIDDTLDINSAGRLTVKPDSGITWDIDWHAEDMPENKGWTRNFSTGAYITINKEEIDTDGLKSYLSLDISKDTTNTGGGIIPFEYYRQALVDLDDGYLITFKTNFTSFTGSGSGTIQPFELKNAQIGVLLYFTDDYKTYVRIGEDADVDLDIDPRGTHIWKVMAYKVGDNTYIQVWVDGIMQISSLHNVYSAIGTPLVSFGNTFTSCYNVATNSVIDFEYVKVKIGMPFLYSLIMDISGDIIGGAGYEWVFDYVTVKNNQTILGNLAIGGNLAITGTMTLGALSGILKASAGLISGSAVLDDLDDITITSVQDKNILQYDSATGKWVNVTNDIIYTKTEIVSCDSNVAIKDIVYVDGSNTWQKAKADNITTAFARGIVLSKPTSTTAIIITGGTYKNYSTGMTSGTRYFLSLVTAGETTATQPNEYNDTDKYIVLIGKAINATDIYIDIQEPIYIAA